MNTSSLVIACLAVTVSCSKIDKLEKKTDKIEKTTAEITSTTHSNSSETKQVQLQQARLENLNHLLSENNGIDFKLQAAASYFQSFDYQRYSDSALNKDAYKKSDLLIEAAEEFTNHVVGIHKNIKIKKMKPSLQGKKYNDEMIFYALASTMHMNRHFKTITVEEKSNLTNLSMYEIVQTALAKEADLRQLEIYEDILVSGDAKEAMVDLIKARIDYLTAMGLNQITNRKDMDIGQKAKEAIFNITGGRFGEVDLPETFEISNDSTKNLSARYFEHALKAKNFLRTIGISKPLEKNLKSAMNKIDFQNKKINTDTTSDKTIDTQKEKIRELINGLLE